MPRINFTNDQQKALDITKPTVVVSAAAGSGKTAVLVERICRILSCAKPDVLPDQLLVVTFTRAAAKEMSERVERRLREMLREDPQNRHLRSKLMIPLSNISTIDSFCQKLVKEYFFYCDMQSDFGIADSAQLSEMSDCALDKAIEFMYGKYGGEFEDLNRALLSGYGDLGLRDSVIYLHKFINSLPDPEKFLCFAESRYSVESNDGNYYLKKQLDLLMQDAALVKYDLLGFKEEHKKKQLLNTERLLETLNGVISACRDGNSVKCSEILENIAPLLKNELSDIDKQYILQECADRSDAKDESALFKAYLKDIDDREKKFYGRTVGLKDKFFANFKNLQASMKKLGDHTALLCETVREYERNFSKIKSEKNLYAFSDIEHKALALIYDIKKECPTELGKELSSRFAYVMADEYQDTNDLQDMIFYVLSDRGKKLFAVGDAKQSIYRFRLANPEVFLGLKDSPGDFERDSVYLSANFRSNSDICQTVNEIFSVMMSGELGDVDYNDREKLIPKAEYPKTDEVSTEYWLIDRSLCKEDDMATTEAHYIAGWIKEKIDNGYEIYDISIKDFRKMRYGDIAILARSINSYGEKYRDVLESYGIPVYFKGSENPYAGLEVRMVLDLLKSLCNPRYDLPLLSLLSSPFCGLTADDIANIRLYSGEGLYSALILAAQDGSAKAEGAYRFISSMRREMQSTPLPLFIEKIYTVGGFYASVGAMADGNVRRANLRSLVSLAEKYDENSDGSVMGFIKTVEGMAKEKGDSTSASVSSGDVVNIMSIHSSKGLEFPVCFVAGLSRTFNNESKLPLFLHRRAGIGMYYYDRDLDMRFNNIPRSVVEAENKRDGMSEELRVLYVALTRAKNKLILLSSEKNMDKKLGNILEGVSARLAFGGNKLSPAFILSCGSYTDLLMSAVMLSPSGTELKMLASGGEITADNEATPSRIKFKRLCYSEDVKKVSEIEPEGEGQADEKTAELLKKRFSYRYPHLNDVTTPSKITASELNRMDHGELYNFTSSPKFMRIDELSAAERGTALHTFMQFCDFTSASADVRAEGARLRDSGFITEKQFSAIDFDKAQLFFGSKLYRQIVNSDEVMRERQFTVLMKANELESFENSESEIVVQGVCDLAFAENGFLTVIDYKTDRCNSVDELFNRYREQLRLYASCLQKVTGCKVGKIGIYSFYKNEFCCRDFTNQQKMI